MRASAQPVRAGEATRGAPAAGRGAAGGDDDGSAYWAWMEKAEGWVRDALEGAAALGGASRALAAALARAGALGAADRLAQRYLEAREEDSESEDSEMFVWEYMEDVLRAVGRHLPEVRRAPEAARLVSAHAQRRCCAGLMRCKRCTRPLRCWKSWASTMTPPACVLDALRLPVLEHGFASHVMRPFSGMHMHMRPSPAQAKAGGVAASAAAHSNQDASESDTGPGWPSDPCACLPTALPHANCTLHARGRPQDLHFCHLHRPVMRSRRQAMRRCHHTQAQTTQIPLRRPSRDLRPRSRRALRRGPCQMPAWRTCACRRPRCALWAAGV